MSPPLRAYSRLKRRQPLIDALESDFKDIKDVPPGVFYLSRTFSDRTLEFISGHGELWSAQVLSAHLNATEIASSWLDARTLFLSSSPAIPP